MARSLHLSFICIPQSTRALDQGGVEPRQAVSPKALRPWTIPLRCSVGSYWPAVAGKKSRSFGIVLMKAQFVSFCERLSASMARSLHCLVCVDDSHPGPGGSRTAAAVSVRPRSHEGPKLDSNHASIAEHANIDHVFLNERTVDRGTFEEEFFCQNWIQRHW